MVLVAGTPDAAGVITVVMHVEFCVVVPAESLMINVAGGVLQRKVWVGEIVEVIAASG